MSNLIQQFNKHRTKRKLRDKLLEIVASGDVPVQDLALPSSNEAQNVWCEFNTNEDTGVKPKWRKGCTPDYLPGKVRVYTPKEIEEYENERLS